MAAHLPSPQPSNPFVPGRGSLPPYLAGRETEQEKLRALLAYLCTGRGAPRDAVCPGLAAMARRPCHWFEREIAGVAPPVDSV